MKKIAVFLCLLFIPFNIFALSESYVDKVASITGTKIREEKINLYLFHGQECPHCEEERNWLNSIEKKYINLWLSIKTKINYNKKTSLKLVPKYLYY